MCTILALLLLLLVIWLEQKPSQPPQAPFDHQEDVVQESLEETMWMDEAGEEK
jgi:hypothetical protein